MILSFKKELIICPSPEYPRPLFPMTYVVGRPTPNLPIQVAIKVKSLPEDLPTANNKILNIYSNFWYNKFDEHTYFFYTWPKDIDLPEDLNGKTIFRDKLGNRYKFVSDTSMKTPIYFALTDPTMWHLSPTMYDLPVQNIRSIKNSLKKHKMIIEAQ